MLCTSLFLAIPVQAGAGRQVLRGHVPAAVTGATALGRVSADKRLELSIGLPLRNQAALEELMRQLYDPRSTNFHKFLTPAEFTTRFGPTEEDYEAVSSFVRSNGFVVTGTHPNRVVLDVEGSAASVEQAFHVVMRTYRHPVEARDFFAPDSEPSVPINLRVADMWGLSDYGQAKPMSRKLDPLKARPLAGSGPGGNYIGSDFRRAYAPGTTLNGAGQAVGLLQFSAYFSADIADYQNLIGLTNPVPVNNVVIGHPAPSTANNAEVALDIEMAISMAPGLSQVIVYEIRAVLPSSILNRMATDNLAKQLSSSWTWSGGPSTTVDNIFKQMASQGQSYFQASGDNDAYTASQVLDDPSQINSPVGSTNITTVGGTSLTMSGAGITWASETVWNWNTQGQPNVGSGGGVSSFYPIPYWQAGVNMTTNSGSTTFRNVPDVALTADGIYVLYNNGSSGVFGGTSCASPLWAGFCALINQQSAQEGGSPVGFLNPALYALAGTTNYSNCFHDITNGNNIGSGTPGLYFAVAGYDLATGLGTPNGTNLINALVPVVKPYFQVQPTNVTVVSGSNAVFGAVAGGAAPLAYQWRKNGTNMTNGAGVSGATSNVLTLTGVATNGGGNFNLVVTNSFGAATSSVATLTVLVPPVITSQPTNRTVIVGTNVSFQVTATGTPTPGYQWMFNGSNLSGANASILTLTNVQPSQAGNYAVTVSNSVSSTNSTTATLTVLVPPVITSQPTNRTVIAGTNVSFQVIATGTPAPSYQWTFNGSNLSGANASVLTLTNVQPSQAGNYAVTVSNSVSSTNSNPATLTVLVPPVITSQPTNRTVLAGTNVSFQVTATGTPAPGYQWVFNGSNLLGATSNVLTLTNVQGAQIGDYSVAVTNSAGSTNSVTAHLTVLVAPTVSGITVNGTNVTISVSSVTGLNYTLEYKDVITNINWTAILPSVPGTGGTIALQDTNAPATGRFYRVRAD